MPEVKSIKKKIKKKMNLIIKTVADKHYTLPYEDEVRASQAIKNYSEALLNLDIVKEDNKNE